MLIYKVQLHVRAPKKNENPFLYNGNFLFFFVRIGSEESSEKYLRTKHYLSDSIKRK